MGKDKKNKKGKQEEDFGEEEVEKQVIVDEKPGKKARKGKSKEVEDSDEEVVPKKKEHAKSKKNHVESDEDVDDVSKKEEPQEKRNKKKGKKAEILSDDDNEEQQPEKKIGKKKGGKKTEVLSDDEVEEQQPEKKNKKKGKKIASEDEESDNEVATNKKSSKTAQKGKKEKKVRVKDRKDESSDEDNVSSKSQPKKGMSAFALLDVEDMDVDMGQSSDEEESKEVTAPKPEADDKKAKKSKKKDRKKKQDDDEDLEKMLEELALEIEGKKPAVAKEKEKTPVDTDKTKTEDGVATDAPKPSAKAKKGKKNEQVKEEEVKDDAVEEMDIGGDDDEAGGTVKTAAQKKKEKKERERLKKLAVNANVKIKKDVATTKEAAAPATQTQTPVSEKEVTPVPEVDDEEKDEDDDEKSSKKKKKKGKGVVEDDKGAKKKPGKKQLAAMQEALKKMKEEEERLRLEEEAKELAAQKAEEERLEKLRLEQERKDKKKQKEKEKKERLKAEGKLLTKAQKQAKARAEATLLALRQQGIDVPKIGEKIERAPRLGDRKKPQKKKTDDKIVEVNGNIPQVEVKIVDSASSSKDSSPEVEEVKESWDEVAVVEEKVEEIKETWDESSEDESKTKKPSPKVVAAQTKVASPVKKPVKVEKKEESEDEDEDDDDDDEESSDEESSSDDDDDSDASEDDRNLRQSERIREKVLNRIHKRKDENEKNITQDKLRSPVVCVLGHVDTGKTKILDKIRNTHVQDGEAGGITQQIGATMVPNFALKDQCKMVKSFVDMELKLPGLLIIDTPGHESFSNLRSRGSSLCDIAILVVDIMHGLEPQTIESLNMLKQRKTPFVVALNKIDRLYEWKSNKNKDVQDVIRSQQRNTKLEFEDRTKEIILQFNEQGLNAALCYENTDQRTYVSLVPTSAFSGDGMGNLLGLVVELSQTMLAKRLSFSEELQATVLEVKAIPGLGTTIDVILVNGRLREGDTIVLAGHEGAVVTQIRSLLMPQPMKELRVKNPYQEFKEVEAAQGVKIAGKDLDKAIAGLQLLVAHHPDEVEILKEEVSRSLKEVMNAIKLSERGVYVQASTLGSLEALLEFLRTSKIPYSGIRIGPVVKKDVMKASIMLEHDNQYAVILAFDVKVERDAQELADSLGVKIFQANIIYHLFDSFTKYREDLKTKKRNEFKHIAVFPCKLRILPQFIFNSRDPIVVGVSIEAGVIKEGTPLCVPSRENLEIGTVTTIEINHKTVDTARKGQEVCIKIEPIGGEAPKMYGRHFDNTDMLVSKITRQSIDACKDYFRDDLSKTDWQLMVELKKMFQIL